MKRKILSKSFLKKLAKDDFWKAFELVHGINTNLSIGVVDVKTKEKKNKD